MNKTSTLFAGFAALALFAACSSDEPLIEGGTPEGPTAPVEGQKAYLNVKISDAGDADAGVFQRSTDFNTPSYEFGNADEHKVNCARFFFFDGQGNFVLKAQMKPLGGNSTTENDNIEYFADNVLVLEDLKSNEYPTYMLTVLNKEGFDVAMDETATIGSVCEQLANFKSDEAAANFVMSTTSYVGDDANHDNTYYSVTKLTADNFRLTAEEAKDSKPVDVYVERLAAKVQVDISKSAESIEVDGKKLYKLTQTVAGDNNDENNGSGNANTTLYLEVLGWGLNATANDSYISKKINTSWTDADLFANWNAAARYRSFWGMATTYGVEPADLLTYTNSTALDGKLKSVDGNYAQYCYENTNTPGNVFKTNNAGQNLVITQNVTHVVLNTRICDENGNRVSMISYRGTLFTEGHFKNYVLNSLKNSAQGLNYYYLVSSSETEKTYRQVGADDVVFDGKANTVGKVDMKLADPDAELYAKSEVDGKEVYTKIENPDLATRLADIQGDTDLFWYNDGANVYYIPVEHNAKTETYGKEGYYGVVRNHWYNITVNSFSRVGHALYDPENGSEILKPEGPEDPLYYVGAKINILSWRVINQGVDL